MSRRQQNEDAVTIKLSSGGAVSLTLRGSFFDLTPDERRLMNDLSVTIERYREAGNGADKAEG